MLRRPCDCQPSHAEVMRFCGHCNLQDPSKYLRTAQPAHKTGRNINCGATWRCNAGCCVLPCVTNSDMHTTQQLQPTSGWGCRHPMLITVGCTDTLNSTTSSCICRLTHTTHLHSAAKLRVVQAIAGRTTYQPARPTRPADCTRQLPTTCCLGSTLLLNFPAKHRPACTYCSNRTMLFSQRVQPRSTQPLLLRGMHAQRLPTMWQHHQLLGQSRSLKGSTAVPAPCRSS
jgi:hypothetical protein